MLSELVTTYSILQFYRFFYILQILQLGQIFPPDQV